MRTPVQAVHLCILGREALCELVVTMILVIPPRGISGRQQYDDSSPDKRVPPLRGRLAGAVAFLLTFSSFFRHVVFLYHGSAERFPDNRFEAVSSRQPALNNPALNNNVERAGQHVQLFAMQGENFT